MDRQDIKTFIDDAEKILARTQPGYPVVSVDTTTFRWMVDFIKKQIEPTHLHKKGGLYRYVAEALHSETKEPYTIYEHIKPNSPGYWVRPNRPGECSFHDVDRGEPRFNADAARNVLDVVKSTNGTVTVYFKSGEQLKIEPSGTRSIMDEMTGLWYPA